MNNERYLTVLVKMEPSESQLLPDLVLSVSTNAYLADKDIYDSLRRGDGFDFEAILVAQGNDHKMHELSARKIARNGLYRNYSDIVVRESALPS